MDPRRINQIPVDLKTPQPKLSELYRDIELTEEEKSEDIERALFEARYTKFAQRNAEEYRMKIMKPVEVKKYTSAQLLSFLDMTVGFVRDDDNSEIVQILCEYFGEDPAFEKRGYNHNKGLLLFGGVGVGKTHLLSMFRNNQKCSYQVVACQDVEGAYARSGDDRNEKTGEVGLKKYYGLVSLSGANQYGQTSMGFMFDDLGQENIATKFYGTERNVMMEVLSHRYKNGLFTSTHLTTNLSAEQIKETYGIRVADRMREMFNLISFPMNAKSRRK